MRKDKKGDQHTAPADTRGSSKSRSSSTSSKSSSSSSAAASGKEQGSIEEKEKMSEDKDAVDKEKEKRSRSKESVKKDENKEKPLKPCKPRSIGDEDKGMKRRSPSQPYNRGSRDQRDGRPPSRSRSRDFERNQGRRSQSPTSRGLGRPRNRSPPNNRGRYVRSRGRSRRRSRSRAGSRGSKNRRGRRSSSRRGRDQNERVGRVQIVGSNTPNDGIIGQITGKDSMGYLIRSESGKSIMMEAKYIKEIRNNADISSVKELTSEEKVKALMEQMGKNGDDAQRRSKSTTSSGGAREKSTKSVDEREKHVFTSI